LKNFRDYALQHAQRWYAFVNGDLGRLVDNGDLYLVTGTEKSASWSLAAVQDHSEDCRISMKLKAAQVGSAGTSWAWEGETAISFADSGPRRRPGEESWTDNQTVFLRGYKVAIRSSRFKNQPRRSRLLIPSHRTSSRKSGFFRFSQSRSGGLGSFFQNLRALDSSGALDGDESAEYFPGNPKVCHRTVL
jgi:hypothetical protein